MSLGLAIGVPYLDFSCRSGATPTRGQNVPHVLAGYLFSQPHRHRAGVDVADHQNQSISWLCVE